MDNLPSIIGPAPSELTLETFKLKLIMERERVRRGLEYFRLVKMKPKGRKASAPALTKLLKESGLTQAQLLKGIELLRKQKAEGGVK